MSFFSCLGCCSIGSCCCCCSISSLDLRLLFVIAFRRGVGKPTRALEEVEDREGGREGGREEDDEETRLIPLSSSVSASASIPYKGSYREEAAALGVEVVLVEDACATVSSCTSANGDLFRVLCPFRDEIFNGCFEEEEEGFCSR